MAEENSDAARETERQAAHNGADHAQRAVEDAAAAGAVLGKAAAPDAVENAPTLRALLGKVHAADSMGRLLSSR